MNRVVDAVSSPLALVRQLIDVSYSDTVYRDLYLWRARTALATTFPRSDYTRLKVLQRDITQAVRHSRSAVICGDWQRVRELAVTVGSLKGGLDAHQEEYALGGELYEAAKPPLDPFLPGFERLAGGLSKVAGTLERLRRTLEDLQHLDPEWKHHYAARRTYFETTVARPSDRGESAKAINPETAAVEALQMLEHGEIDGLRRLAEELIGGSDERAARGQRDVSPSDSDRELATPLSAEASARARDLGFACVDLVALPEVAEYFRRNAFHPTFSDSEHPEAGATRVLLVPPEPSEAVSAGIRELMELLAMHPYVNSGGARYVPRLRQQPVLFEDFSEEAEPPLSPVLDALGFDRRRALSRVEIETALLQRGAEVLTQHFNLDPWHFRLLCIPFDVYTRVGEAQGWGRREQWTHFDGYQLMRDGQLRALVGGDARYGGVYDLVSIGADDQREHVVVRFAVVRRERLLSRLE